MLLQILQITYMTRDINNIPEPAFGSELNTVIVELEKLRIKPLYGSVPPYVFFQLKEIFQALESLGSARIEGNRTTVSEYAEKIIAGVKPDKDESMCEIVNIDKAIDFIEKNITQGIPISGIVFCGLWRITISVSTSSVQDIASRAVTVKISRICSTTTANSLSVSRKW